MLAIQTRGAVMLRGSHEVASISEKVNVQYDIERESKQELPYSCYFYFSIWLELCLNLSHCLSLIVLSYILDFLTCMHRNNLE